jgi:hypothetical protein
MTEAGFTRGLLEEEGRLTSMFVRKKCTQKRQTESIFSGVMA